MSLAMMMPPNGIRPKIVRTDRSGTPDTRRFCLASIRRTGMLAGLEKAGSEPGHDLQDFVLLVAVPTGESQKLTAPSDNLTQPGRISCHRDASATLKFEQSFVT